MAFDGIFLHKLMNEFDVIKSGRISKIYELTDSSFMLTIRANRLNYNLILNLNAQTSRIHLTNMNYEHTTMSKPFSLLLKKQIEGYFISDIYQYESDRIVVLKLEGFSEMKDRQTKYLIVEIMGRFSNLILTNEEFIIIDSLHHDGISEFNRIILPNVKYQYPVTAKINPYTLTKDELGKVLYTITTPKDLITSFLGTSYTFANKVFSNDNKLNNFYDLLYNINNPVTYIEKDKLDFYFDNDNPTNKYDTLSELLDNVYYELDRTDQVKRASNDLLKFINRQINKFTKKIEKLNDERKIALECEEYKLYGELLLSYPNLKEKTNKVEVLNYYTNLNVLIPLEEKYNVLDNSQRYYKKYQKLKKSIAYIDEQTAIASKELEYFKLLKTQSELAGVNDIKEIIDELIDNKYLFEQKKNNKKKQKPNITTYKYNDSIIYVGKNNLQNEYITHQLGKANDYWFHVKDAPGSHVVIHSPNPLSEAEIRLCANLAAYFSFYKDSSSVSVDYTLVRNIKKIPGHRNCFVRYKDAKTIYIDPNYDEIKTLKEAK